MKTRVFRHEGIQIVAMRIFEDNISYAVSDKYGHTVLIDPADSLPILSLIDSINDTRKNDSMCCGETNDNKSLAYNNPGFINSRTEGINSGVNTDTTDATSPTGTNPTCTAKPIGHDLETVLHNVDRIMKDCSTKIDSRRIHLRSILTTHHHWDHSSGNAYIKNKHPEIEVYGGSSQSGDILLQHNQKLYLFQDKKIYMVCISTPCHTKDSFCYALYINDEEYCIFTGDTLFVGGCGRFTEGDHKDMVEALMHRLYYSNSDSIIFNGHDYCINNWKFCLYVDGENVLIKKLIDININNDLIIGSTMGIEKLYNPFLRANNKTIRNFTNTNNDEDAMRVLRESKNSFNPS